MDQQQDEVLQVAHKRLSEHESVLVSSIPSVSDCTNDILNLFANLSGTEEEVYRSRYRAMASLDNMRFLMQRVPDLQDCLDIDLDAIRTVISESGTHIEELMTEKIQLEKDIEVALNHLKEMNELEKRALGVNKYSSREELQKSIDDTQKQISCIDEQISALRKKMEDDSKKLHSIYEAFVKVKNEILGIEVEEKVNTGEEMMEIEE